MNFGRISLLLLVALFQVLLNVADGQLSLEKLAGVGLSAPSYSHDSFQQGSYSSAGYPQAAYSSVGYPSIGYHQSGYAPSAYPYTGIGYPGMDQGFLPQVVPGFPKEPPRTIIGVIVRWIKYFILKILYIPLTIANAIKGILSIIFGIGQYPYYPYNGMSYGYQ